MAKSKIIKELANREIEILTALTRAKVLLQNVGSAETLDWINYEISGYPFDTEVPEYRKIHGVIKGSYFEGSMMSHMKYSNVPLPLGKMSPEGKEELLTLSLREGIEALSSFLENNKTLYKSIPADFYPIIAAANGNLGMIIQQAVVELHMPKALNIFSVVANKLLDILLLLEKSFGILDELDIDISSKDAAEICEISRQITVIIYDNSVTIGDNNEIIDSEIASLIETKG